MRSREVLLALTVTLLVGACSAPTGAVESTPASASSVIAPTTAAGAVASSAAATVPAPVTTTPAETADQLRWSGAAWTNQSLRPLSEVSSVGGVPVLLAQDGDEVLLVGLDADDGTVSWRRPAGHSGVVPGIAIGFGTLQDRYVAYFEPLPFGTYARLVIVDPQGEGTEVARSATMRFSSYPSPCDDDDRFICVEGSDSDGAATFRLRPGMAELEQVGRRHAHIQSIGPAGLVRTTDAQSGVQNIGVQRDGKLLWSKPERALFGPKHTTDGGWAFDHDSAHDLIYGSVGPDVETGDTISLKDSWLLVAFDARTGAVRWQHPGLQSFCDRDFTGKEKGDPFVVCEWTRGKATVGDRTTTDASLALRRVDPLTGRTLWRTDLGSVELDESLHPDLGLMGPSEFLLDRKDGPVVVSLRDGRVRPRTTKDESWRDETVRFEGTAPYTRGDPFRGGETTYERYGVVDQLMRESAAGKPLRSPLPASIGARVGDLRVVATKDAVLAFPAAGK